MTEIVADSPLQIEEVPEIVAVGSGFTVIVADPVRSAGNAEHRLSWREAMVYVVVAVGLTETGIGLELPLNGVPLDKVPFQGPVPVTAILSEADCPVQISVVPVIMAVGLGITVMTAEPVPVLEQLLSSETEVTV